MPLHEMGRIHATGIRNIRTRTHHNLNVGETPRDDALTVDYLPISSTLAGHPSQAAKHTFIPSHGTLSAPTTATSHGASWAMPVSDSGPHAEGQAAPSGRTIASS